LEAFSELLRQLPLQTGMAFVLVQHLDPKHSSELREILARTTKIPVAEVTDGTVVRPDHIYVIPPNTVMLSREEFYGCQRGCSLMDSTCRLDYFLSIPGGR